MLSQAGSEARLIAGGTDLLVKMKRGSVRPRLLVSLGHIEELRHMVPMQGQGFRIGALATMRRLTREPLLGGGCFAALVEGADSLGGPVIRNRATLGGNIVSARPCADTVPPLVVLGALLRLETVSGGQRTVALDGFITGPGVCGIRPDEILTAIELPERAETGFGSSYVKITRRAAMEVTIVGCAASVTLDESLSRVASARIALASVAPVPLRALSAEEHLVGEVTSEASLRAASVLARRQARPVDDHRAPAAYRSDVVEVIVRRTLRTAIERAGGRIVS